MFWIPQVLNFHADNKIEEGKNKKKDKKKREEDELFPVYSMSWTRIYHFEVSRMSFPCCLYILIKSKWFKKEIVNIYTYFSIPDSLNN